MGNVEIVRSILKYRHTDPSGRCNEPITVACAYGIPEIAIMLLDHPGFYPLIKNNEHILWAMYNGNNYTAKLVISHHKTSITAWNNSILNYSIHCGAHDVTNHIMSILRFRENIQSC
jgi:hypothetical protein